jgi:hypothetical protein
MKIMITANGTPAKSAACRSASSPPLRGKTNAIAPITAPQARQINLLGSMMPPTGIAPSRMVPVPALVARKIESTKIDTIWLLLCRTASR